MDNFNFKRTLIEDERSQIYSQPQLVRGKLADNMNFPPHIHGRIVQCSQTPGVDWKRKVDMSKGSDMDYSEAYTDVDVSGSTVKMNTENLRLRKVTKFEMPVSDMNTPFRDVNMSKVSDMDCSESNTDVVVSGNRAKMDSENLHLKIVTKFEMPVPASDMNGPFGDYIDRKLAAKKVVPPVESKDENPVPQESFLGFQHKKRPLKRSMTADQQNATYIQDPVKLKETADLIQKIKDNKAEDGNFCITYNSHMFSDIINLVRVPNAKITSGSYGDVMKVFDTQTKKVLIQKMVKKNSKRGFDLERNEIEIPLQFPDAENIARFFGLVWKGNKLIFIMEDAGISLRELISSKEHCLMPNEPGRSEKIMLDSLTAVAHLAKHGITHCDIKPENVCLNVKTWVAKLVDFGSSKTLQNEMTYIGVTPEYLEPLANKFLYEHHVLKNKNYPLHVLGEMDDVYSTGIVGLFLFMKCHPMIFYFVGCSDYPNNDPADTMKKRLIVMKMISEMTHEMLIKFLNIPMSDVMKELLSGILELDRNKRWTSERSVLFLQEKLYSGVQPPNKLQKQERQSYKPQLEDMSKFVNLHDKNMDIDVAQRNKILQPFCDGPTTPDVCKSHDAKYRLGVDFKEPALSAQSGRVLMPAKLKAPLNHGEMRVGFSAVPATTSQQETGNQLLVRPKFHHYLPEVSQEDKEYADLVQSFNVKLAPSMPNHNLPAQINQPWNEPESYTPQLSHTGSPQRMLLPNAETCHYFNSGSVQNDQQRVPSSAFAFQGITGSFFNKTGGLYVDPTIVTNGNIPDIDAIMQSGDEQTRRKIKGVRKSRASQD